MHEHAPRSLSDAEKLAWLRLIRSENVGPVTFFQLLRRFGTAAAALQALPELARRGGRPRPIQVCSEAQASREIEALAEAGAQFVALGEPHYPPALAAIDDAPPLLSVKGNAHLLTRRALAIVGARNASALAVRFTRAIAAEIGRQGMLIVSGMARGIDTAAHLGALESGTVAVLGGGVDVVYPPENAALYEQIAATGAVVAEMPVGTQPLARHFPRRNRLISGMALGVLVAEAAPHSGSLITARFALEQGREVFAVPGSPLDPRARGGNDLIRQGAILVETAEDVMREIADREQPMAERATAGLAAPPPAAPDEAELALSRSAFLRLLGSAPVELDEVMRQSGIGPAVLLTLVLELELAGRLERHPGNKVSLL